MYLIVFLLWGEKLMYDASILPSNFIIGLRLSLSSADVGNSYSEVINKKKRKGKILVRMQFTHSLFSAKIF